MVYSLIIFILKFVVRRPFPVKRTSRRLLLNCWLYTQSFWHLISHLVFCTAVSSQSFRQFSKGRWDRQAMGASSRRFTHEGHFCLFKAFSPVRLLPGQRTLEERKPSIRRVGSSIWRTVHSGYWRETRSSLRYNPRRTGSSESSKRSGQPFIHVMCIQECGIIGVFSDFAVSKYLKSSNFRVSPFGKSSKKTNQFIRKTSCSGFNFVFFPTKYKSCRPAVVFTGINKNLFFEVVSIFILDKISPVGLSFRSSRLPP